MSARRGVKLLRLSIFVKLLVIVAFATTVLLGLDKSPANAFTVLAPYDSLGVPSNLRPEAEVYSAALLDDISASLPERSNLSIAHPEFLADETTRNLHFTEDAQVTLSFIHEGAGYRNVTGIFRYDTAAPPVDPGDAERLVIFPNSSFLGSGGGLLTGDSVELGTFFAGESLGFFVMANGYNGSVVTEGLWSLFSIDSLNPESDPEDRKHTTLLLDPDSDRFVIAFEDIRRDNPGCDHDFNDVILSVQVTPASAVALDDVAQLVNADDLDGDGVENSVDDYPEDPDRAFLAMYPPAEEGTLAFEDLWPSKGDYDFNDLVVSYRVLEARNADNQLVDTQITYEVQAMGAAQHNGLAVRLPVPPAEVAQITRSVDGESPVSVTAWSGEDDTVATVFIDAYNMISPPPGYNYANTVPGSPEADGSAVTMRFFFTTPLDTAALAAPPYDSFLTNGANEIHLPGFPPTGAINADILGTEDDATNLEIGYYYKTAEGHPWALHMPAGWAHPKERTAIDASYEDFVSWASASGNVSADWYMNPKTERVWSAP